MYKPRIPKLPKCPHPGCPEPWHPDPWVESQCVLNKPLLLYIPPGQHVHMACPAHPGGHVLYGSNITWGDAQSPPPFESSSNVKW